MKFVGIDIGSTCAKTVVLDEAGEPENLFVIPTGWSSFDALEKIRKQLMEAGVSDTDAYTVSTGYGRKAVPFAQKQVTEITCQGSGGALRRRRDEPHRYRRSGHQGDFCQGRVGGRILHER